ncbi:MAG: porin [Salinisphaeraceae bacterium]
MRRDDQLHCLGHARSAGRSETVYAVYGAMAVVCGLVLAIFASLAGAHPHESPSAPEADASKPADAPESDEPASPHSHANVGTLDWEYSSLGVYGPTYTSPDEEHKLTLGLFVWFDNTFVTNDDLAEPLGLDEIEGDSRLRTARLELHGTYTDNFSYYFRVDFQDTGRGSGDARIDWGVLGIHDLPFAQNLLIGLQQPLYGLDLWAAYPRHRLMLEPSLVNAFYRGPLLGITAFDVDMDRRISWALGIARDTTEERVAGFQAIDVDRGEGDGLIHGRLSWFPRYRERGRHMLHFGLSGAYLKPDDDVITFGFYPEIFTDNPELFPLVTVNDVGKSVLGVLEFRFAEGPFWMQSDYVYNQTSRDQAPDLSFDSFYVEAGYFLTGEQSVFSPLALNGPVTPEPRVDPGEGEYGAFEIQARYSRLDLTDEEFQGGAFPGLNTRGAEVTNYTLGFNWYLNAHIKLGINYVHSVREDLDDARYDAVQTRLAWHL